ncbi:adhesion G protein-coupled receptor L3-like [Copidosoma floridanum]|uniref:adhesion G protein-coupled receptor L3-like n=1 Tax=Copidosoma floridanum TaxID=29053 RepID=UPI000C6F626B|nr:adhesion G protein-coupled receptor L3-like [Copidosoma floridanum]
MLVFLLGLTWTFGLLFMNRQTLVMAYIFTALNSLQGLIIFVFHCLLNKTSNVTNVHKNLCICLLIVQALFVGGVEQTSQKLVCGIIARLLHFFLLCAFAWMFIEGLQLYFMLIKVFETGRSRMRWYYLFAYGMPLMVVAIACALNPRGYGTEHYCWLKTTDYFIFSFVGPVIIILVINFGFLCMAMNVICRRTNKTISANTKVHSQMGNIRTMLKGSVMLVFLLGLTWTFGLLFMNRQTLVMAYIFTALNSLQGLIIFVFHCLLNKTVCKEYQQFIEKYCCEFKNKLMNDNGPTSSSSHSNYRL